VDVARDSPSMLKGYGDTPENHGKVKSGNGMAASTIFLMTITGVAG